MGFDKKLRCFADQVIFFEESWQVSEEARLSFLAEGMP